MTSPTVFLLPVAMLTSFPAFAGTSMCVSTHPSADWKDWTCYTLSPASTPAPAPIPTPVRVRSPEPAAATAWPDSSNTGYKNAPGYPGSLTTWKGTFQSGQTYKFYRFPNGLRVPDGVHDVTFYGCDIQQHETSESVGYAAVFTSSDNITIDYSTIEPSVISRPPVAHGDGYQYGWLQARGLNATLKHSNVWGFANGVQINNGPFIIQGNYFHDTRDAGGIDHTDAILENYGGVADLTIDGNTIVASGNANGLALQNNSATMRGYKNVKVTNNYFSGFGYTVNLCGHGENCNAANGNVFTGNTFGTDLQPSWGPLYGNIQAGYLWRNNKWHVAPGGYDKDMSKDGRYWWPDGTLNAADYAR